MERREFWCAHISLTLKKRNAGIFKEPHLDPGLRSLYPTLDNKHRHHSVVLSLTHYHLQYTGPIPHYAIFPNGFQTLVISHSPWLISMSCHYYGHTWSWLGKTTMPGKQPGLGSWQYPEPNNFVQWLARHTPQDRTCYFVLTNGQHKGQVGQLVAY